MEIFRNIGANDNSIRNSGEGYKNAFTLAEMMVVLLIASVILACMAPIMTTKMKADSSIQTSPWKWAKDNVNAYFGPGSNQAAMIGQNTKADTDNAKLIINNSTNLDDMILFKAGESTFGHLQITGSKTLLGTLASSVTPSTSTIAIGRNLTPTGGDSIVIGNNAKAEGANGVAIGNFASAGSGGNNVSLGSSAKNGSGSFNVAIGSNALSANNTGSENIAIGYSALTGNISAGNNLAIGSNSLRTNTIGRLGIAIGNYSLNNNTIGNNNIAIGYKALYANTIQNSNIAIGAEALQNFNNNTNERKQTNVAIGTSAMSKTTTGHTNTFVGTGSGYNNTTGSYNTGLGHAVLQSNTTDSYNTALGFASAQQIKGTENTSVGALSLIRRENGYRNTAVGYRALGNSNGADSSGNEANYTVNSNNNTALGYAACANVAGSNKTCIGAFSGPNRGGRFSESSNTDKVVFLGDSDTTVYIPGNLVVAKHVILNADTPRYNGGSYQTMVHYRNKEHLSVMMSDGRDNIKANQAVDQNGVGDPMYEFNRNFFGYLKISDRRLKNVGKENTDGLAKLRQLKIYDYTYKNDKDKAPQVGVIAQDLQKVFPNAVKKAADGFFRIRLEDMFYAVINAIKELDTRVTRLEKENQMLKQQNKELELRLQALEKKIK